MGQLLVYIPPYNVYPLDKAWEKVARTPKQLDQIKTGQRYAVSTYQEYIEKIAQPRLDAFIKNLNPGFVSRAGLSADEIINKFRANVFSVAAYKKYGQALSTRQVRQITDKLPLKAAAYAAKKTFGDWRLEGALTGGGVSPVRSEHNRVNDIPSRSNPLRLDASNGASALEIILGWLAGDKKIISALRPQDELKTGRPVLVTVPERTGQFRRKLRLLLKRMLDIIICAHYDPKIVSEQNDRLNRFVNGYLNAQIVPFVSGGASHLDWLVNRAQVKLRHSPEVLAVHRKIYEHFLSPEAFQKIAPIFEPPPPNQAGPEDLLMDMYLDIKIISR